MTKIYIISDEKYNALRAISDTERGERGYSLRAEAVNTEAERLIDSGIECENLSCICEGSPEDWTEEYISPSEDTLYSELCGVYLMTREAYDYWQEALAAIERGEDPFN